MNNISIKVFPRIHISLLDMSNAGYRINGGIGFFINEPNLTIHIESSKSFSIDDKRCLVNNRPIPKQFLYDWLEKHVKNLGLTDKLHITISGNTPSHAGFGSSTAIRMACVEGIHLLQNQKVDRFSIIQQSCRGGTSGIGVHGYFSGGMIFDLGHAETRNELLPSRNNENNSHLPLLLKSVSMPNWEIGIVIPHHIQTKNNEEEKEFFRKTCPISRESVYETTYHSLFGLLAAADTNDINLFCEAVRMIQKQDWKRSERNLYSELTEIEKMLYSFGADAVGMSSLGPMLYFFSEKMDNVIENFKNSDSSKHCTIFKTRARNEGREIIYA